MNQRDAHFEVKEVTENGNFAGYGSVYGVVDQGDDIVTSGAFADSLAQWYGKGRFPALLWQHKANEPIGAYTAMREDANGLYVEGKLALKTQRGAEAYELMKMGALSGLSIGFQTREDAYDQKSGVRTIKKGDLWEVSLVTFPMNDDARVAVVKSIDDITDYKSLENYLRDAGGYSRTEAKAIIAKAKSLAQREAGSDDEAARLMEALTRNLQILKS